MKGDTKFKGKLTHGMKNDIKDLVNFHASSRKSKTLMDSFCSRHIKFQMRKKYRRVLITQKNDAKLEEKLTLASKNDMRNLVNFNASCGKSKNLHFDTLLLSKVYCF